MHDRPTAPELLSAARTFLEKELVPTLTDPRLKFQTLIAANVIGIVERELATEEADLLAEWSNLNTEPAAERTSLLRQAVKEVNQTLCERIRAGEFDEPAAFAKLAKRLSEAVIQKLKAANPKYLAAFS